MLRASDAGQFGDERFAVDKLVASEIAARINLGAETGRLLLVLVNAFLVIHAGIEHRSDALDQQQDRLAREMDHDPDVHSRSHRGMKNQRRAQNAARLGWAVHSSHR